MKWERVHETCWQMDHALVYQNHTTGRWIGSVDGYSIVNKETPEEAKSACEAIVSELYLVPR